MIYENGVEFVHETTGDKFNDPFSTAARAHFMSIEGGLTPTEAAVASPFGKDAWRLTEIGNSHRRNWIDCIRSRKNQWPTCPTAHTSMLCSMANIGYEVRYELRWNTKSYRCSGKLGGTLANRPGRGEWKFI